MSFYKRSHILANTANGMLSLTASSVIKSYIGRFVVAKLAIA